MIDKNFCMSQYLAFRFVFDENKDFFPETKHKIFKTADLPWFEKVKNADEMKAVIDRVISEKGCTAENSAILLSGGMDSATIAASMPKGSRAYTFKSMVEGAVDEVNQARKYANAYGLDLHIVEITWDDFEKYAPILMKSKGAPIHSIEVQLYKAALQAKADGVSKIAVGESADLNFGGMDKMLAKDWTFDEWVKRYNFCDPAKIVKHPVDVTSVYEPYRIGTNGVNFVDFIQQVFGLESSNSYAHVIDMFGFDYVDPYAYMGMAEALDLQRVRSGDSKYLIRDLFRKCYPNIPVPNKIPMPRAVAIWLKDWKGPTRKEFLPNCIAGLSGDQKWQLWCLEQFLNMHDRGEL